MKIVPLLVVAAFGLAFASMVSMASPQVPPPGPALPPPGLHDPGVDAAARQAATAAGNPMAPPAVALPAMHDAGATPGGDEPPPEVTIHQHGDDSVQEYWRAGQIYMVVVTPKNGIPYTYMLGPQGSWVDEHGQKTVRPVMYKILEWGKSKPAVASSGG